MIHKFKNRAEAGELLAKHLRERFNGGNIAVVALPRGGLVVGLPIAKSLGVSLQALVVRKLGAPHQPELAIGALASGGFIYLNHELIESLHVSEAELKEIKDRESTELLRREALLNSAEEGLDVRDRQVILVDDGIATGATIEVALRALRAARPSSIVIAVPIASLQSIERLHRFTDHIYSLQTTNSMVSIGDFYESFPQVSDEEAIRLLAEGKSIRRDVRVNK